MNTITKIFIIVKSHLSLIYSATLCSIYSRLAPLYLKPMTQLLVRNLLRCFDGGEHYRLATPADFRENGRDRIVYGLAVCHYHLGGDPVPIASLLKEEVMNVDDFVSITSHGEQQTVIRRVPEQELERPNTSGRHYSGRLIKHHQERVCRVYETIELCKPFPANDDGMLAILYLVKRSLAERAVHMIADACGQRSR